MAVATGGSWPISTRDPRDRARVAGKARFIAALRAVASHVFDDAARQGDNYFFIPALGDIAESPTSIWSSTRPPIRWPTQRSPRGGEAAIDSHAAIVGDALRAHGSPSAEARASQLAYHTLYLFRS